MVRASVPILHVAGRAVTRSSTLKRLTAVGAARERTLVIVTLLRPREQTSLLRFNSLARFVRWHRARDGRWYPEIIQGRYDSRDESGWTILCDGDPVHLPEDQWAVYRD